ncbi:hypothetical protein GCM10011351_09000 [Paraliobacillus quinghaiensis]|uniref:Uncharacterized protein n=1 Tax=Paraliobacillus quinghaiensis TaxID=470815 RepID=A0A917TK64_9BACI|nr:hypothetical protein [Paraliobacillus quinghaiensis]GGM25509.1 hypothetical protein GCM10011351_09000 [Paraliobacillus quinghaiensis]
MITFFVPFALFVLFLFNTLTNRLCLQTEMSKERQPNVFRTINVLITILLISSYIEIIYT